MTDGRPATIYFLNVPEQGDNQVYIFDEPAESATLQADSSIGWYFYNGRKFERREPAESAKGAKLLAKGARHELEHSESYECKHCGLATGYWPSNPGCSRTKVPESATPAPELSDKDGWVYDPDAKLAEIRAGMLPPLGVCDGERAVLHQAGACCPCENWRAPTGRREGEKR